MNHDLTNIGKEEFTEKVSHGFLDIYQEIWWPKFNRFTSLNLLEIGVYNGNSLKVWERWFHEAQILGVDKHHNTIRPELGDRVKIEYGDQTDKGFLLNVANAHGSFDIIIDDASHIWKDQQFTFEVLWGWVKSGGMYIIEDLHTSLDDHYQRKYEEPTSRYLVHRAEDLILEGNDTIKSFQFFPKLAVIYKK